MISIIIPVYNAGLWLRECLDSLLAQKYSDFEVICVNDASTDNSMHIIEEYVTSDNRYHLINLRENQGAMMARKYGIDSAKGNYFFFCDADDTIPLGTLNKLIDNAMITDADMTAGDIALMRQDGHLKQTSRKNIGNNSYSFLRAILTGTTCSLCGILFKRQLFYGIDNIFLQCCNYSEDRILLTYILCHKNCAVTYFSDTTYFYHINALSSTRRQLSTADLKSQLRSIWISYDIIDTTVEDVKTLKLNQYFILRMIGYIIEQGFDIKNLPGVDTRTKIILNRKNLISTLGVRLGTHIHLCCKNGVYRNISHSCRRIIRRLQGKD
ncbi:MAG: glycosyltransferase [Muribaculum sp.]|nr:glycosyltransferase [Muribaculum sp.]